MSDMVTSPGGILTIITVAAILAWALLPRKAGTRIQEPDDACLLHHWRVIDDTGLTRYYQCHKCQARAIKRKDSRDHQQADLLWLQTGRWEGQLPPPGPSNIVVRSPNPLPPPKSVRDQ